VDAHHDQELGLRPAREVVRLAEDEGEDGEAGRQRDQRLEQLDREIRPVLELVQGADPEEDPEQAKRTEELARRLGRRPFDRVLVVVMIRRPPRSAGPRASRRVRRPWR